MWISRTNCGSRKNSGSSDGGDGSGGGSVFSPYAVYKSIIQIKTQGQKKNENNRDLTSLNEGRRRLEKVKEKTLAHEEKI